MDLGIVSIIISIVFAVASIISSICLGLVPNIRKSKIEKLEKKVHRLLWDVKLFYEIEEELLSRLSATGNKDTIKKEVRKIVSDRNNRPLSDESKPSVFNKQLTNN